MSIDLKRYLNTTVLVSIPTLFHDSKCRPLKLLGVELSGVWLQSDELTTHFLPEEMAQYAAAGPVVFLPFAHIAGIVAPTGRPTPAKAAPTTPTPTSAATARTPDGGSVKGNARAKAPTPKTKSS